MVMTTCIDTSRDVEVNRAQLFSRSNSAKVLQFPGDVDGPRVGQVAIVEADSRSYPSLVNICSLQIERLRPFPCIEFGCLNIREHDVLSVSDDESTLAEWSARSARPSMCVGRVAWRQPRMLQAHGDGRISGYPMLHYIHGVPSPKLWVE